MAHGVATRIDAYSTGACRIL